MIDFINHNSTYSDIGKAKKNNCGTLANQCGATTIVIPYGQQSAVRKGLLRAIIKLNRGNTSHPTSIFQLRKTDVRQ